MRPGLCHWIAASFLIATSAIAHARDWVETGLQMAHHVYGLPTLEEYAYSEFEERTHEFTRTLPWEYRIASLGADLRTGLKWAVYAPRSESDPTVVAFAGTQNTLDWITDLDDGLAQARTHSFLMLARSIAEEAQVGGEIKARTRNLLIAGHSLGGALAQTFGYAVLHWRMERGLPLGQVRVVTANALGAQELIGKLDGPFDRDIVSHGIFRNYYVPGDVISRIGTQVGPTLALPDPGEKMNVVKRHSINTAIRLYREGGAASPRPRAIPSFSVTLRVLRRRVPEVEKVLAGVSGANLKIRRRNLVENRRVVDRQCFIPVLEDYIRTMH